MIERLADFVVHLYLGKPLDGWHTKIGALSTTLLALSALIVEVVQALTLLDQGHYIAAYHQLANPTVMSALTTLGGTKIALGLRSAIERVESQQLPVPSMPLILRPR